MHYASSYTKALVLIFGSNLSNFCPILKLLDDFILLNNQQSQVAQIVNVAILPYNKPSVKIQLLTDLYSINLESLTLRKYVEKSY